jgi:hypothetical protein
MPNLLPLLQQDDDTNLEAHVEHYAQRAKGPEELAEQIEFAEESRETILSYARRGLEDFRRAGTHPHTAEAFTNVIDVWEKMPPLDVAVASLVVSAWVIDSDSPQEKLIKLARTTKAVMELRNAGRI